MKMNLVPYKSVGAILFNSGESLATSLLGVDFKVRLNLKGEKTFYFESINLVFTSNDQLKEITFFPESKLLVSESNIFEEKDVHGFLRELDSSPLEYVGLVFYPKLGLSIGGTEIGVDFSITAIAEGRFDLLLSKFKPFKKRNIF